MNMECMACGNKIPGSKFREDLDEFLCDACYEQKTEQMMLEDFNILEGE